MGFIPREIAGPAGLTAVFGMGTRVGPRVLVAGCAGILLGRLAERACYFPIGLALAGLGAAVDGVGELERGERAGGEA